jgi:hypothetical protein
MFGVVALIGEHRPDAGHDRVIPTCADQNR